MSAKTIYYCYDDETCLGVGDTKHWEAEIGISSTSVCAYAKYGFAYQNKYTFTKVQNGKMMNVRPEWAQEWDEITQLLRAHG